MKAKIKEAQPGATLRLIDTARVCDLLGMKPTHVEYLRRADPSFPQAVRLGPSFNSAKRWAEHEILEWVRMRMLARNADAEKASQTGAALASVPRSRRGKHTEQAPA